MGNSEKIWVDSPVEVRESEQLKLQALQSYLEKHIEGFQSIDEVKQFPSGFSNLTYFLRTNLGEFVLRRPPFGANIKSAHDMLREFHVLEMLHPTFGKVPKPILHCDDESIIGSEFYMMERINGFILRSRAPKGMEITEEWIRKLSRATIEELANLHNLDTTHEIFKGFGRPEGYCRRQVEGWIRRYAKAMTDDVPGLKQVEEWMTDNIPETEFPGFIHNDFKFDNVVIDADDPSEIKAILDWEMATIGDTLMDLGTSLGYWSEGHDPEAIRSFSLTALPGNYSREEIAELYFNRSKLDPQNIVFYYVYGSYKIAVICQQIYARYKKGLTKDKRFAMLIYLVHACIANASRAIEHNRISHLY